MENNIEFRHIAVKIKAYLKILANCNCSTLNMLFFKELKEYAC
ncbi:hypothetical protein [Clostridium botulinum]|nr:hypothetical protein [Clostridium botulinum]